MSKADVIEVDIEENAKYFNEKAKPADKHQSNFTKKTQ